MYVHWKLHNNTSTRCKVIKSNMNLIRCELTVCDAGLYWNTAEFSFSCHNFDIRPEFLNYIEHNVFLSLLNFGVPKIEITKNNCYFFLINSLLTNCSFTVIKMSLSLPLGTKCCVETCGNVVNGISSIEFHQFPAEAKA